MTDATRAAIALEPATGRLDEDRLDENRSLASDAWRALRHNKLFWVSSVLITLFVVMAIAPQLFTGKDPTFGDLRNARQLPSSQHWFGTDYLGYDIYARCIYGARASIMVGVLASLSTLVIGSAIGVVAGYRGGWVDSVLSRFADVFFAIPLLLGGIVVLAALPSDGASYLTVVLRVVAVLVLFGWPGVFRLMRSSVLQVKPQDYVQAARALGASPWRVVRSHVLPNALSPVIVVSTINLGMFITVEAALSFLGIGLTPPTVSWGVMINDALVTLRMYQHILLFPSLFLCLTVLGFILLGDAVRDAFDPKSR